MSDQLSLEQLVHEHSFRHDEPFVLASDGREVEIWYLVPYCLEVSKEEAVIALMRYYIITENEANAAWLWISINLERAKALCYKHTEDEEILAGKKVV